MQADDKIGRQERAVGRHARHPIDVGCIGRGPIEAGEHTGERARKARHAVRDDRQRGTKTYRIAIGIDHERCAGRPQHRDHAVQQRHPADPDQRLVAAPHAAREAAREHKAKSRGMIDAVPRGHHQ
ncbi:hypothetical protein BLTE_10090 [Blastochloris tepida]|uniref:Uncharacterized protein n=1 Tax=Blastochloris tepida TaxID=2233851 RepID=A0A348FYE1_9HYPH|nr:hypothetical protein BLTE_10090 [Blastochloris tepida]